MANTTETTDSGAARPKSDELKQKLSDQIAEARSRLDDLQSDLKQLSEEDRESLEQKSEEIRGRLEQGKQRAQQMRADIVSWKNEKIGHTRDAIASWQQRREVRKLQSRAERAEDYALQAVTIAALDFEEAEQAVVDAVVARLDAEAAAGH